MPHAPTLAARFAALDPAGPPADELTLRPGTLADYAPLAAHHYLRRRPVTATAVWVLADARPTVVGRYLGRRGEARPVGVLVVSLPALACALRDVALGGRYRGLSRSAAARLLNAEVRCISRVVVHPQWRGLGLAVRLVRHALDHAATAYTEALAAMGRVHPFFKRAGMIEYHRWPLRRDQRLLDALAHAGCQPWMLADGSRLRGRLARGDAPAALMRAELSRWAGRRLTLDEQLAKARDELLCEPLYYLHARDAP